MASNFPRLKLWEFISLNRRYPQKRKKEKERLNFHPIPRQIKAILIIDIFQNFKRMISMKLNFSKHSRSASDEGKNLFERKVNSKKRRDDWSKKRERENKETKEKSIPF